MSASNQQLEPCPLTVHKNVEGTWDILVDGELTNPRMTLWTEAGANEVIRRIHDVYSRSRVSAGGVVAMVDEKEMVEALAALAHEQWSGWMRYLFSNVVVSNKGAIDYRSRWQRQIKQSYLELSEEEKESDRQEARRMIEVFRSITAATASPAAPKEES